MKNKITLKSSRKVALIIAFTIIASGFTSFSNHPTWGYWWSGFGFLILIFIMIRIPKKVID